VTGGDGMAYSSSLAAFQQQQQHKHSGISTYLEASLPSAELQREEQHNIDKSNLKLAMVGPLVDS
jgi:hypothetical protein